MEENKPELTIGSLYDINKNLVQNQGTKLSEMELNSKKEIIKNFLDKSDNFYFMLLCNERKDYTVFEFYDCRK